jgi:hypothetical protein
MRDLSSDAEKEVLFDLSLPTIEAASEKRHLVSCSISYVDVADGLPKCQEGMLTVRALQGGGEKPHLDVTVEAHRCRLLAAKAMEQAAAMLGKADPSDVQVILSEAIDALEQSPAHTSHDISVRERIAALTTDLCQCLESVPDPRSCEKLCSSRAFAHKHQISTRAEGSEYRNSLQQALAEAARKEIGLSLNSEVAHRRSHRPASGRAGRIQPTRRAAENVSSNVGSIPAGAVRQGMRIMCRGEPGVVQEVSLSKTGKHGHAKAFFTVLGDDGTKRQDIVVSSHDVELAPEVETRDLLWKSEKARVP